MTAPTDLTSYPVGTVRRMPPGTPLRNFRCAGPIWEAAQRRAAAEGTNVTAVLVAYLEEYGAEFRVPEDSSS